MKNKKLVVHCFKTNKIIPVPCKEGYKIQINGYLINTINKSYSEAIKEGKRIINKLI